MFHFIETSRKTQTSDSWSAANISVRLDHSTVKTRTALKWISCDVCKRWLHEVFFSQPTPQDSFFAEKYLERRPLHISKSAYQIRREVGTRLLKSSDIYFAMNYEASENSQMNTNVKTDQEIDRRKQNGTSEMEDTLDGFSSENRLTSADDILADDKFPSMQRVKQLSLSLPERPDLFDLWS
ncbi:hypothetical protein DPMN_085878, partial [Dreissena polymorpha]